MLSPSESSPRRLTEHILFVDTVFPDYPKAERSILFSMVYVGFMGMKE